MWISFYNPSSTTLDNVIRFGEQEDTEWMRIDNVKVEVEPRPDDNDFEITVSFDIVGEEFPTQEFSFILEATR